MPPLSRVVTGIKIEIARFCGESGERTRQWVLRDIWNLLYRGLELRMQV